MRKSRLSKSFQKKSRNTLIISILAIVGIIFLLFRYGLPFISDASFIFGRATSTDEVKEQSLEEDQTFVPIPNIDSLPKATNESEITLTGTSLPGLKIDIFLNGAKVKTALVNSNGDFDATLDLTEGENIIKTKAIKNNINSDFSNSTIVIFKKKEPELSIDSPSDGAEISGQNPIEVKGKTDPGSSVIVNDFQAITNSNGDWSYLLTLRQGDNEIKVSTIDSASNKAEKVIRVKYSP